MTDNTVYKVVKDVYWDWIVVKMKLADTFVKLEDAQNECDRKNNIEQNNEQK